MIKRERGFTLIELLVVIAIIGVLSSVVLSSLNSARGKGNDAKVKAQLSSLRGSAEIYYADQSPNSYLGMCNALIGDSSGVGQYLADSNYPAGVSVHANCYVTATAYKVWGNLPFENGGRDYWCVDSSGNSKVEINQVPASDATPCL